MGKHTGVRLAVHLKDVLTLPMAVYLKLRLMTIPQTAAWLAMYNQPLRPPESGGRHWETTYHCMAHMIQLALDAFMSIRRVKYRTNSWEAHMRDQRFGANESIGIGISQRLQKEGNARIKMVLALRPGLAKIFEKVCILRNFESPETDLYVAANACCIDYADTRSSKQVHWLSESFSTNSSSIHLGFEETVECTSAVAWASLPITRIHPQVVSDSNIDYTPATLHHTRWMDHCQVHHGWFEAILIPDPVDIDKANGYSVVCYHSVQWHVWSYRWQYARFMSDKDTMQVRHTLLPELCMTEAVQLWHWSYSCNRYAVHVSKHPWSVPEVATVLQVGQGNGYESWGWACSNNPIPSGSSNEWGEWILCQT